MRVALIKPFKSAVEQLQPEVAVQFCQRFLPVLAQANLSSSSAPPSSSLDSFIGLYLSLLCRTGKTDSTKLNVINVACPTLCWLRAAVAVTIPRPPISASLFSFMMKIYSLALKSLSSSPSCEDYLRYVHAILFFIFAPYHFTVLASFVLAQQPSHPPASKVANMNGNSFACWNVLRSRRQSPRSSPRGHRMTLLLKYLQSSQQ